VRRQTSRNIKKNPTQAFTSRRHSIEPDAGCEGRATRHGEDTKKQHTSRANHGGKRFPRLTIAQARTGTAAAARQRAQRPPSPTSHNNEPRQHHSANGQAQNDHPAITQRMSFALPPAVVEPPMADPASTPPHHEGHETKHARHRFFRLASTEGNGKGTGTGGQESDRPRRGGGGDSRYRPVYAARAQHNVTREARSTHPALCRRRPKSALLGLPRQSATHAALNPTPTPKPPPRQRFQDRPTPEHSSAGAFFSQGSTKAASERRQKGSDPHTEDVHEQRR